MSVIDAEGIQHGQLSGLGHQQRVGQLSASQVPHQAGVVGVELVNHVPRAQDLRDASQGKSHGNPYRQVIRTWRSVIRCQRRDRRG